MSVCRQICRKALRGCLRVPGCKPVCYMCLRPVCYGVSDSEDDDDDSDKEDGRFFRNAHHIQECPSEDLALREQGATETSAVVEYYNDTSILTPPAWQIDKSPSKDENRGYTNVMGAEDMRRLQSISNVEYDMCVSNDRRCPPSHDYVNMTDGDGCDVTDHDTGLLTISSHQYHNIDQVCMTSDTGGSRSHLDALLIRNQEPILNTLKDTCPNLIFFSDQVCDEKDKVNGKRFEDGPSLQYCSLESINKTEYRDLPTLDTSHMVRDTGLVGSRHSLGGDQCVDKVCPNGEQDSGKCVKSTGSDQLTALTNESTCRTNPQNNESVVFIDVTNDKTSGSAPADGTSKSFDGDEETIIESLKVDDNSSSCSVDTRFSSSVECTDDQTNDQVDTVNDSTNIVVGHVDDSNTASTSGVPNGHLDSDDVSFEASLDKSQTLIMLETDL
ncbi:uncharacterized protein LOC110458365 [Mizuhopecten yessoensis]|uniref:Uncharacterized protein n=1 Tax=Mizuhopecten yessoensis TaxID=6573 RepID=A0A210R3B3_MIZYE|nr:uncharacterized protein LOC110458365 [Mizuhopecten yessoensis]OWF55560.1 hypothetical protein KP79_PYT06113 [Mizuhopecten yessoensis]